jgi:hypothetical protein
MKSTYNPNWFTNEARKQHCLRLKEESESLFMFLTDAVESTLEEDKRHIDCTWDGKKVDVKGYKPSHEKGYVVVEVVNNYGYAGWCSLQSEAEIIAFQFQDHFMIVDKLMLRELVILLCPVYHSSKVIRSNFIQPEEGLYQWCGREGRQDVYTYLTVEDLEGINPEYLDYAFT